MAKRTDVASSSAWAAFSIAAAGLWVILRSGTGVVPGLDWQFAALIEWPTRSADPNEWFLSDSPLGILGFRALGLSGQVAYLWLHVFVAVISLGLLAWWVARQVDWGQRARAARLALLAPVGAVVLAWLGSYDAFTLAAWVLALFAWGSGRLWVSVVAAVPLGFQHGEHAALGVVALTLVFLAVRELLSESLRQVNPLWLLAGVVLGKAVLLLVFVLNGTATSGRVNWLGPYLREWTALGANVFPLLLWSLFAGTWAVVLALAMRLGNSRSALLIAAAVAVGLVATFLSADRPRVFVIVMIPATALMIVAYLRSDSPVRERQLVEAVVWLAPPILFWGKEVANANVVDLLIITGQVLGG